MDETTVSNLIRSAVEDYAIHHGVEPRDVLVDSEYDAEGDVLRFRMSLDGDGRSHGCDEWRTVIM